MKPLAYLFSTSSHSQVISINSLDITFLKPSLDASKYDYFILTSKQAVEALKQYSNLDLKPAFCISKQTALAYENIGGEVLSLGSGYGDSLKDKILEYSKSKKYLYLRAKVIASHFVEDLQKEGFFIDEIIFYKSECSKEILHSKIENNATLIFTSPSSVKCFLKNNEVSLESKVIVIGLTTAKALPKYVKYILSKEKTIQSCLELL